MSVRRPLTAVAAAAVLIGSGLALATPASAAASDPCGGTATDISWDATGTPGDIAGAWARGHRCWDGSSRPYVSGYLEDTKSDGMAACLQIHATYSDGGTRDEWAYVGGYGKTVAVGPYTFATNVREIWVREGVGTGGQCTKMAGGVEYVL
jgi:hypothetical protein